MASVQVNTMNLSDDGEGMVPLHDNPSTSFMQNGGEKNISQSKETMDSTPINDIMMTPYDERRAPDAGYDAQMTAPQPQGAYPSAQAPAELRKRTP